MNDNTAKIINIDDYLKARLPVKADIVQDLLDAVRSHQDAVREEVSRMFLKGRKLNDMETLRDRLIECDILLLNISSFLDKAVVQAKTKEEKEKQETMQEQCAGLQSTNDKIKKLVTDDITNHKSYAVNAITAAGTMLVTPFSVEKVVETFVSKQPNILTASYEVGAILGIYLAFHHKCNKAAKKTVQIAAKMPDGIKIVHHRARNAAFALTMIVSVSAKRIEEIETRKLDRFAARPKIMIVAKL